MLDRSDIVLLLMWGGISFVPLITIYFVEKSFFRSSIAQSLTIISTFKLWLAWLLSTISALFLATISIFKIGGMFGAFWPIVAVLLTSFLTGTIVIFLALSKLAGSSVDDHDFESRIDLRPSFLVLFNEAFIVNLAAWASGVAGLSLAGLVFGTFEWLFPPTGSFGIYDVL